ncbi:Alpha/Beta hydrolase protein [Aspergillus carlsbadensis]|nr:Alpha/Beta hydrolase protein [Aspergillus carlsbadensis]
MADLTKIQGFDLIQETYKYVGDHAIRADILVPQTNYTGKRPAIARFHGGGLVMGDSLYMDWFPYWLSDLALEHEAVIISANYHLMPQATGAEIYKDVEDFWSWLFKSDTMCDILATHTTPTEIDLAHVLVTGESAGGLLSIHSALSHAATGKGREGNTPALAMYPIVDMSSSDFTEPRTVPPFGQHFDESVIDEILAGAPVDEPVSSTGGDYLPLLLAAIEYGRLGGWYARDLKESELPKESLYPLKQLEKKGRKAKVPRGGITIIQGLNDTVVPADHSEPFVEKLRKVTKGKPVHDLIQFVKREGEHGFDGNLRYAEEEWLQDALEPVVKAWLE